ncbi:zinc finger protein 831 [Ambystoma mexicanum]|uniref:zinc finger protein 831 n=1 Tax=Ambystoma mexicanum TaxID=8296 RepID=UPI0037E99BB7
MEAPGYAYITDPNTHKPDPRSWIRSSINPSLSHPPRQVSGFEPQTVYLNTVPVPLYHVFQQQGQQVLRGKDLGVDSSNVPVILSPIVHSEKLDLGPDVIQKQQRQTLTLNIVGTLPVLSPGSSGPTNGSPGKSKNAGKYMCKNCGRDCLKPSVLEKHMRSHTGERPFPCTTCGIAFKTQSNLYKHRRTQTHVNNARLSSESEGSILEERGKPPEGHGEQHSTERGGHVSEGSIQVSETGTHFSEILSHLTEKASHLSGIQELQIEDSRAEMEINVRDTSSTRDTSHATEYTQVLSGKSKEQGAIVHLYHNTGQEPLLDPQSMHSTIILPPVSHVKKMLQEERFSTASRQVQLQRQQSIYSEKALECPSSERKLKKCESTDSGYLSHSDSVDQQTWSSSPLHSLCEQSSEAEEHELNSSGPEDAALSGPRVQHTPLPLEKEQLEEHICKLISQNKAVVDDTHLDNVRPRKTALSKQGSIDLPMPYTYKDSFHFDIKALGSNRKNNYALCSAKSTLTPSEKFKPLFFHSVPTQVSTTIDCLPVTRSNSLPFVESTKNLQDQSGPSVFPFLQHQPLDASLSNVLPGGQVPAGLEDSHHSHPRALVRQIAVDHLPSNQAIGYIPEDNANDGRKTDAQVPATKCPKASRKGSQRKVKMFSQEKWQMYGDETFKKIYQKKDYELSKKLRDNKETQLNDRAGLSSPVQVESSRGVFTTQADARAPDTSLMGMNATHLDSCPDARQVTSHLIDQGSVRNPLNVFEPPDQSLRITRSKTVSIQEQSCLTSPNLVESSSVSVHSLNIGRERAPQPPHVTQQPTTIFDAQHSNLIGLDKPNIPALDHASRTYDNGDRNSKAVHQHIETVVIPAENGCNKGGSIKTTKEGGKLPSEKKKPKVEDTGLRGPLRFQSSASGDKSRESINSVIESGWYTSSDFLKQSSNHLEEEKRHKDDASEILDGRACEKMFSHPNCPLYSENAKPLLDNAGILMSKAYSVPHPPNVTRRMDWMMETHQIERTSLALKLSAYGAPNKHFPQSVIGTASSTQQGCSQSVSRPHNTFSPMYLLKLPTVKARAELLHTSGPEDNKTSSLLSDTATGISLSSGSRLNKSQLAVESGFSFSLPAEPTQQSVIVEPSAQRGTFPTGFPTTSVAVSIITCMAYGNYAKNSTDPGMNKDTCLPHHGMGEAECKNTFSTTNIDSSLLKKSKTTQCRSSTVDSSAPSDDHKQQQSRENCQLSIPSDLSSGQPSAVKQGGLAEGWRPYTSYSDSLSGPLLDQHSSDGQPKISLEIACKPGLPSGGSVCHTVTAQQRGSSVLSKTVSRHLENKSNAVVDVSFPSLNTELCMTWCCQARNLPCTAEQKNASHPSCFSPQVTAEQSILERPGSGCKSSLLDMMSASTHLAKGSSTTEIVKAKELWMSSLEQQQKGDCGTIVSSAKSYDHVAKAGASRKNQQSLTKRCPGSKKMKIRKKGCRGSKMQGYAQFKASRMGKQQWLPRKMSTLRKKPRLLKTRDGLQEHRKWCTHDEYRSRPEESGRPASTGQLGPGSAEAEDEDRDRDRRSAVLVPPVHSIRIGEIDDSPATETSSTRYEGPDSIADLQSLRAPAAAPPITDSSGPTYSAPRGDITHSFSSMAPSPVLQHPVLLECKEAPLPDHERAPAHDDRHAFTQHLFDNMDPVGTGLASLGISADNPNMEASHLVLSLQGSVAPKGTAIVKSEWSKDDPLTSFTSLCAWTEQEMLLADGMTCSLPSELMDTALPTLLVTGCCEIVSCTQDEHVAGYTLSPLRTSPEQSEIPTGWGDCSKGCQETDRKGLGGPPSPQSVLELGSTSDTAPKPTKKRSLDMVRKPTQVEYTDTSSDDDRLVIEIEN